MWVLPVFLVLVTVAAVAGAFVMLRSPASAAPADTVVPAARGDVSAVVTATGTVTSTSTSPLAFATDGVIAHVDVAPGQVVAAGDVVAGLDDSVARARLDAARSRLDADTRTRAVLGAAVPPDLVAQSRLDGTLADDRTEVTAAQSGVDATVLHAPQDGTVTDLTGRVGARVAMVDGGASIGTVADLGALAVVIGVGPADVPRLAREQSVDLTVDGIGNHVAATVTEVAPVPGPGGNYPVTLGVEAPPPAMRVGQGAVASVVVGQAQQALLVPRAALRSSGASTTVLVRRREGDRSVAVGVGLADDRNIQITRGLSAGDLVVVPGDATTEGASR